MPPIIFPVAGISAFSKHIREVCGIAPTLCGAFPLPKTDPQIAGVTQDETGAPAGGYTVYLFEITSGNGPVLRQTGISDGSGNYLFHVGLGSRNWVVSYKTGAPDKAGVTVNTLYGT